MNVSSKILTHQIFGGEQERVTEPKKYFIYAPLRDSQFQTQIILFNNFLNRVIEISLLPW